MATAEPLASHREKYYFFASYNSLNVWLSDIIRTLLTSSSPDMTEGVVLGLCEARFYRSQNSGSSSPSRSTVSSQFISLQILVHVEVKKVHGMLACT